MGDLKDSKVTSFPVTGMSCAACAVSVESTIKSLLHVNDAQVNYASQKVKVSYNPSLVKPLDMRRAVQSAGYDLIIDTENKDLKQEEVQKSDYDALKKKVIYASFLTIPVVILGMFFMDLKYANYVMLLLTFPVVFYFGRSFFTNAFKQIKHGRANMDTLVALSTGIAFLFSVFNTFYADFWQQRGLHAHVYFEAAAVIVVFILLGKLLEANAKGNTSSAIKKLIGLQSRTVILITDDGELETDVLKVKAGDSVLVRPGEKIPLDGKIFEGSSYVDESMISGEPLAILKEVNSKVFAGTINQRGSFRFFVEKESGHTMLAQIIKLVEDAQGSKAPVQKKVDRIAGVFVPVVILIAIVTLGLWVLFGNENAVTQGLMAMVTVLVIACPCALGLAVPTAIMVGIGKGAEQGILIKDAESLELGYQVNALVLDKTGTITEGKPAVISIEWDEDLNGQTQELTGVLFALEQNSEHPLSTAITEHLQQHPVSKKVVINFESTIGIGVSAKFENETYTAGSHKILTGSNAPLKISAHLEQKLTSYQENTIVYFADSRRVLAIIAIADQVKSNSKSAIGALQQQGIEVFMLTGDNNQTAFLVAKEVGIDHFQSDMLPSEKALFIEKLQADGKVVAMVGDGINDSQALAQANVSIAMGRGSDIAIDVAKMTLISSDLSLLPKAFLLSKSTVKTINQNLFWAFIYNLIGIPIAAGLLYPVNGFMLDPMIAGAAMALSSVSVVTNSLRLKIQSLNS
ncbi:MAG: copper-translocating P-type ATPase [Pedobacter sp.]|nr:MAG: copper-translocating P-type ATPase [Pedobacter sp.]